MCINSLQNNEKQITETNIKVIKILKNDGSKLISPIFYEEWKIGEEICVDLGVIFDGFSHPNKEYRTTSGLYSYDISCDPLYCLAVLSSFGGSKLEAYEAIIPEKSEYVKKGSQYCSNRLIIQKKIS